MYSHDIRRLANIKMYHTRETVSCHSHEERYYTSAQSRRGQNSNYHTASAGKATRLDFCSTQKFGVTPMDYI